ncbi:MAG: Ger(x)C family spore germination protein [Eubacteriales bacterium]
MKKIMIVIFLILIVFLATGFEDIIRGRTEIENLYSLSACGVDKKQGDDANEFLITTVSPTTEENAQKPCNIMSISGRTVFEANRLLGIHAEKDIFWGHNKYILIGDEAAKEDLFKYLDFFMRDQEVRLSATPLIVRGTTAQKFITSQYEQNINIPSNLENIIENQNLMSYSSQLNLVEFINLTYESKNGYLPYLELETESRDLFIEQGSEKTEPNYQGLVPENNSIPDESTMFSQDIAAHIPGYALIKEGKVIEYISDETGRGLSWIINKVVSGTIVVDVNDNKFNLEIINSKCIITPKIKEDILSAEMKIIVSTNISEIDEKNITVDDALLKELEEKQKRVVQKEIQDVLEIIQKNEIDIIGVGDKFYHKYPVQWKKYKEDWNELFSDLEINVVIDSNIERSYKFKGSVYFKEVD